MPRKESVFLRTAKAVHADRNRVAFFHSKYTHEGVCDVLRGLILDDIRDGQALSLFQHFFVEGEGYKLIEDVMPAKKAQEVRVLALLFCREIAKDPEIRAEFALGD